MNKNVTNEFMITWKYKSSINEYETFMVAETEEAASKRILAVKGKDKIDIVNIREFNRMKNP